VFKRITRPPSVTDSKHCGNVVTAGHCLKGDRSVLVDDGASVDIAGVTFSVRDLGAGECATAALWLIGDDAFVGDLVYSRAHPWLDEARSNSWLEQLECARPVLEGRRLYVGHGAEGGVELIAEQERYIRAFLSTIRELSARGTHKRPFNISARLSNLRTSTSLQ
jgi:hypothetical protein